MGIFATWNYGPAYLEVFLDMLSWIVVGDVIAIALLFFFCRKRRKKSAQASNASPDLIENTFVVNGKGSNIIKESHSTQITPTSDSWSQTEEYYLLGDQKDPVLDTKEDDQSEIGTQTITSLEERETQTDAVVKEEVVVPHTNKDDDKVQISAPDDVSNSKNILLQNRRLERSKSRDDITFKSGWRKTVKLLDLIKAKLILESRVEELEREEVTEDEVAQELHQYLVGKNPIAGIIINETGQKMSLYHAYKQGIISRGTAVSLLEAQAATGSIIDPETGAKMSVVDATESGLIDKQFQAVLSRAERAVTGYSVRHSDEKISLFKAMKQGKVVENHGIRLLEAQIATGGIIDPEANHRLPIEVAYERGLFDERLHQILEDPSDDTKGFLDPNTTENLSYLELIQRCLEDANLGLLYLPVVTESQKEVYKKRHSSSSSRSLASRKSRSSAGGSFSGVE